MLTNVVSLHPCESLLIVFAYRFVDCIEVWLTIQPVFVHRHHRSQGEDAGAPAAVAAPTAAPAVASSEEKKAAPLNPIASLAANMAGYGDGDDAAGDTEGVSKLGHVFKKVNGFVSLFVLSLSSLWT